MRNNHRPIRLVKLGFCLLLSVMLCMLCVFAINGEAGINAPTENKGRSGDHVPNTADNIVTDAAEAIGGAVSDAANAVGDVIGEAGDAAGALVSDAGEAVSDVTGGTVQNGKPNTAVPFDTQTADNAPVTQGSTVQNNTRSGVSWVLVLILVAAAAAIFALLLMPRTRKDM